MKFYDSYHHERVCDRDRERDYKSRDSYRDPNPNYSSGLPDSYNNHSDRYEGRPQDYNYAPRHGPRHGDGSATPPTPPQSSNHPDFFRDDANSNSNVTSNGSNNNKNATSGGSSHRIGGTNRIHIPRAISPNESSKYNKNNNAGLSMSPV